MTGVTTLNVQIAGKRLELVHELLPKAAVIAALVNPANPVVPRPRKEICWRRAARWGLSCMSCEQVLNVRSMTPLRR